MTPDTDRDARGDVFLSVFLTWMLTAFGFAASVVALYLIAFSGWGEPGSGPQIVSALMVAHLIVGLGAIAAGVVASLALRERARLIAWIVLGAVALSAAGFLVGAWIAVGSG